MDIMISPEGLEVAQAYLMNGQSIEATAKYLGIPVERVSHLMDKREVKAFVDKVFLETGFRNREKMGAVWDAVLAHKLEEMEDTGLGSSKDIIEILEKMHKFKMAEMEMQIKLLAAEKAGGPQIQVNTQNNFGGEKYNSLVEQLMNAGK